MKVQSIEGTRPSHMYITIMTAKPRRHEWIIILVVSPFKAVNSWFTIVSLKAMYRIVVR